MGKWILAAERQPAEYGKYRVLRRAGTKYRAEDVYLWNGGYWVTRCGNPTKSVQFITVIPTALKKIWSPPHLTVQVILSRNVGIVLLINQAIMAATPIIHTSSQPQLHNLTLMEEMEPIPIQAIPCVFTKLPVPQTSVPFCPKSAAIIA